MESKHLINVGLIFIVLFSLINTLVFTGIFTQTHAQMVNTIAFCTACIFIGLGMILYWRFGPRGYKDIDPEDIY